jgi:hypothetical protein
MKGNGCHCEKSLIVYCSRDLRQICLYSSFHSAMRDGVLRKYKTFRYLTPPTNKRNLRRFKIIDNQWKRAIVTSRISRFSPDGRDRNGIFCKSSPKIFVVSILLSILWDYSTDCKSYSKLIYYIN